MSNAYTVLKNKHQEEVNAFPFMFAFGEKQFEEGMKSLGLTPKDTDKIYSIGSGGFIRKTDEEAMNEMFSRHEKERTEAVAQDKTGEGYIYEMFLYEMGNHEYGYTGEIEPVLAAVGLTYEEIMNTPALKNGFVKAQKKCRSN
ncbi:hypothetical protein D3C71_1685770 [compost metagenome]